MNYTLLGDTGLRVSSIALGAMTFGTEWGFGTDEAASRRLFDLYAERGGNFIDTANIYTGGTSERMVGAFLKSRRERFVLATKYSAPLDKSDLNSGGNGRKALVQSLDASLRRLGTDYVDLYWVHMWDGLTPVEETLRALDDVVRAGKVHHVGFSDFPAWTVARADALAEKSGWTRPAAIQIEYNLAKRDAERDLLPMAERIGMSVVAWAPLAGGALTGKYLKNAAEGRVAEIAKGNAPGAVHYAQYGDTRTAAIARQVVDAAAAMGCSPAQLAIAWLIRRSPLIGARTPQQLVDTLDAAELAVPDEIMDRLDEVSTIDLGFPHDFLRKNRAGWYADADAALDPRVALLRERITDARSAWTTIDRPSPTSKTSPRSLGKETG